MLFRKWIIVLIALFVLFSGCVRAPPEITPAPSATPSAPSPFTVNVTSYPGNVKGEANFTIQWEVSGGAGNITHTAVHFGFKSGGPDVKDYGRFSKVYTGKIPQQFIAELIAPESGPIYFRAHAMVDGKDVYTPEYTITINP